jgi:hypothetical protein
MNSSEIDEIYKNAKKDPTLFSKLDPEDLLRELAKDKHNYIENKTNKSIMKEIKQSIVDEFGDEIADKTVTNLTKNLIGYRMVDELDTLHIGQYTRWIQKYQDNVKLTNGGILLNTTFTSEGINLTIKLWNSRLIQVRFDDCLVYQKLSFGEQLILMASEYVNG